MQAWFGARTATAAVLLGLALSSATASERIPLATFVRDAVAANATTRAAEASLRAHVERRAGAARSYPNPELSVHTEEIGAFGEGDHQPERRLVVALSSQLDLNGKRQARVTVAEAERLVALAQLDGTRAATTAELLRALARWQTASARVRILATYRQTMADFAALAQRRRVAGDLSRMDANLATLALAETRIGHASAEGESSAAAEDVRRVTFVDNAQTWPTLDFELPPLTEAPAARVSELPVVRAAMLKARAAAALAGEEARNRRPNPTLSLGVGREAGADLAEISVSVPLMVVNRGTHAVSAASAEATAAAREGDDIARRALVHFEASAERYRIARRAWRQWQRQGVRALDDHEALLRRSWEASELDPTDYLVHVEAAVETRLQALDLRHAAWQAWFDWLLAAGRLDDWLGRLGKDDGDGSENG